MNNIFGGITAQFQQFYKSLGPTKRTALIASVMFGIMAVGAVIFMASGKDYAVLLTNIPSDQVPAIIEKLNAKKYSVSINGRR